MCRLIQFLYSGIDVSGVCVYVCVLTHFYFTYVQNHTGGGERRGVWGREGGVLG